MIRVTNDSIEIERELQEHYVGLYNLADAHIQWNVIRQKRLKLGEKRQRERMTKVRRETKIWP
jgi:hypothetical protein